MNTSIIGGADGPSAIYLAGCIAGSDLTCLCGASGSLPGLSTETTGMVSEPRT